MRILNTLIVSAALMGSAVGASAQIFNAKDTVAVVAPSDEHYDAPAGKEIYIPEELRSNDFSNPNSKWSYKRCAYTDDVIVFWERPFGDDLAKAPMLEGQNMTVDLQNLLERIQAFYNYFKYDLKFILPGSNADRYRMMVMLTYSLEGTAYGGDYDGVIGALWITPGRVQDKKLNCIAHELGHSFQSQIVSDKAGEGLGGGGIYEMTSQWMLFNVNPEWPTDENYHWKAFCKKANLRFLDASNIYCAPYVLEYWSEKHGLTVIGDLWRAGKQDEDPAATYMRYFKLSTVDFAKECCDCYSKLITFDFKGKHEANKKYAGEFVNGEELQMYGANVIKLDIEGKKSVSVKFKGEDRNDGYAYRLVLVDDDANARYSGILTAANGKIKMTLPEGTTAAYFVVIGYPKGEYKSYMFNPYDKESKAEEPHIYKYKLDY